MSSDVQAQSVGREKLEHVVDGTTGSSASSETGGESPEECSRGAFFDVARFWKGAEIAQPGLPSIIPESVRALSDFARLGASTSTVGGSAGNSANGGSDSEQAQGECERPKSPGETEIGQWASRAHTQDLEGSDDGSGSAYSHASAVDLAGIDAELGLSEGVSLSPVTTGSAVDRRSPPPPPDMPSLDGPAGSDDEAQMRENRQRASLDDMEDLRLDFSPPSTIHANDEAVVLGTDGFDSQIIGDGYVDLDEDNLGTDGKHIYGSDGRKCSFAESFARKKGLGRVATARKASGPKPKERESKKTVATSTEATAQNQKPDSAGLVARATDALVELLDEKKAASARLTEGTRAFSSVFTGDEKEVFGVVVRAALGLIRQRASDRDADKYKKDTGRFELAKTRGGGQMVVHRAKSSSAESKTKKKPVPDLSLALTQRVLLGTATKQKQSKLNPWASGSRGATGGAVMLITDGRVTGTASGRKLDVESAHLMTPRGPLARSSSNETLFIQLPFASALLSVLAALARLDCELIFKRRKNRGGDNRRNAVSEHDCATVHARARQDRSNRHFTFSVVVQGSSPAKISFRRPKFIAIRRVDDYVDIVLDSKELITEYCTSLWGQAPGVLEK